MGNHSKRRVHQRAKAHVRRVKAGHRRKTRARSRGLHPASKRRRARIKRRR